MKLYPKGYIYIFTSLKATKRDFDLNFLFFSRYIGKLVFLSGSRSTDTIDQLIDFFKKKNENMSSCFN